jgi:hypothetical protein
VQKEVAALPEGDQKELLEHSRYGGLTVWGRFLLRGTHRRRLDGGSFLEWRRSGAAVEGSGGTGRA